MAELIGGIIDLFSRSGRTGARSAIGLGAVLVPFGLWLFFNAAGPDHVWPIMLFVTVLGVALVGMGLGALFGNQGRLDAAITGGIDTAASNNQAGRASAELARVPFGACSDCRCVIEDAPNLDRCPECFSLAGWVYVAQEADRSRAVATLS